MIGGLALVAAGLVPGSAAGTETTRPQSLQAGLGSQQKAADRAVGTGIIRWDNTYAEASGYERFAYVLVARHFARQAAHLPGTSLVYMNGTTIYSRWSTGVSYEEALASGWLLKHADGSYFTNKRFRGYVADVGDRLRWILLVEAPLADNVERAVRACDPGFAETLRSRGARKRGFLFW